MATLDDVLARLDALEKQQAQTLRGVALLARHLGAVAQPAGTSSSGSGGGAPRIASDAEIDDPKHGDKAVRKDPKGWTGDVHVGERWSECPPDYLDAMAAYLDRCAYAKRKEVGDKPGEENDKQRKYATYDESDAAKCRAWAARHRKNGWTDKSAGQPPDDGGFE